MILTDEQLAAITQIKNGLVLINQMWGAMQELAAANRLDMSIPPITALGRVLTSCNGLVSEHNVSRAQAERAVASTGLFAGLLESHYQAVKDTARH